MAGPRVMSAVPLAMRRFKMPGAPAKSRIPMSTGTTSQWATAAIRQTAVRCPARPRAAAAVTLLSVWVTPWATTPLSAQSTSTARGERAISVLPVRAAMSSSAVSSRPSPPSGCAQAAQRAWAAARAASSGGAIAMFILVSPLRPLQSALPAGAVPQNTGAGTPRTEWAWRSRSATSGR